MADRILTTHVGSLPRTPEILEANRSVVAGEITQEEFREIQKENVEWVVKSSARSASTSSTTASTVTPLPAPMTWARGGANPSLASAGLNSAPMMKRIRSAR